MHHIIGNSPWVLIDTIEFNLITVYRKSQKMNCNISKNLEGSVGNYYGNQLPQKSMWKKKLILRFSGNLCKNCLI